MYRFYSCRHFMKTNKLAVNFSKDEITINICFMAGYTLYSFYSLAFSEKKNRHLAVMSTDCLMSYWVFLTKPWRDRHIFHPIQKERWRVNGDVEMAYGQKLLLHFKIYSWLQMNRINRDPNKFFGLVVTLP